MNLIEASFEKAKDKIRNWRNTYSKNDYPQKLVDNAFYQIVPTEQIWSRFNAIFPNEFDYNNFDDAFDYILDVHRQVQTEIRPNFEKTMREIPDVGCHDYLEFKNKAIRANVGENDIVEQLEYFYIWVSIRDSLMLAFLAWGVVGLTWEDAYEKTCNICGIMPGLANYKWAQEAFDPDVSIFMKKSYIPNFE